MKKIFVLCAAAIVALSAVSCQKDDTVGVQAPEFNKEGLQKYTFTVSGVETKMAYDTDKTNHKLTPKWAVGDKIYVYGSETGACFQVKDVADNGKATVEGYAEPGSGQLTLIYHPSLSGKPGNFNLKAQEGHLDKNFPAIYYGSVDLGATKPTASFNLKSFILEISKVTGISKDSKIDSIIVEGSNIASGSFSKDNIDMDKISGSSVKVTLTSWANSSNVVGNDGTLPESVFISLAPGSISKITVWTNDKSEYCWTPANAISLTGGEYKFVSTKTFTLVYPGTDESPVKVGDLLWAPVNCGFDNSHPNGLLYQWGRKYGQVYNPSTVYGPLSRGDDSNNKTSHIKAGDNSWYSYSGSNDPWDADNYNPCPDGWHVPTKDQLLSLFTTDSDHKWKTDTGLALFPKAGVNSCEGNGSESGVEGYYWSANNDGNIASYYMHIADDNTVRMKNKSDNGYRSRGMSVRCVKSAN